MNKKYFKPIWIAVWIKAVVGVLVLEFWRYLIALLLRNRDYLGLCNRFECLEKAPDGSGFRCRWQWTSDLHAPKVFPFLGRWIIERSLADHPIEFAATPARRSPEPEISFVIGHKGLARLPHLLATLESIAGQKGVAIECVVVEQDVEALLIGRLPHWVHHIHTPPPTADMPYCRSWAFNVGVKVARGNVLVLHDNDMLVPNDYAVEIFLRVKQGYGVINPKRFVFYLSKAHSEVIFNDLTAVATLSPEVVVQNLEAGGSIAITREAYDRIGGMDESFIGWGGEDNEFWARAKTCNVWPYGFLPLVHLWHPAQPQKSNPKAFGKLHFYRQSEVPVEERISRLLCRQQGLDIGPYGYLISDDHSD